MWDGREGLNGTVECGKRLVVGSVCLGALLLQTAQIGGAEGAVGHPLMVPSGGLLAVA